MPFADNSHLVTTADLHVVATNNTADIVDVGTAQADAYYFNNAGTDKTGSDQIVGFGKNDSILNYKPIFDGNGDGIIDFGPNGILDIDRVSAKNAGHNQITLLGMASKQLRYLGNKEGYYVYADASVKLAGFTEGTVGNDKFDASKGAMKYFYDTALGLNLGGDTITNFGADDQIITTTKIHNGADAGAVITFGKNLILDLPGDTNGIKGDIGYKEGGQIDLGNIHSLALLEVDTVNGVTYYHYGLPVAHP